MANPLGIALGQANAAAFSWNDGALQQILAGPNSAVARDLARRAIRVESRAKLNASGRPGPNVITGRLRSSIAWRIREDRGGLLAQIGTNVSYARYLELGDYPFLRPALLAAAGDTVAV